MRSLAFETKRLTDHMLNDWDNRFRLSQNVGRFFQYPRWSVRNHAGAKRMSPSHLKGGTWLKDVGKSTSLTAQMVRGLTGHAPIGHFRHRFNIGDKVEECDCDRISPESSNHIIYRCRHYIRPPDIPSRSVQTPLWDFYGTFTLENPKAFAFKDAPHLTSTDGSTRKVKKWSSGSAFSATRPIRANARGRSRAPSQGGAPPRGTVASGRTEYGRFLYRSFALSNAHVNVFVYNKQPRPRARSQSLERCMGRLFFQRA